MISPRFPYLPIRFEVRQRTYQEEALIDTGFDGSIAVPPSLLENLGPPDGHELWRPVVGPPILAPAYRGSFEVGALGPVPVTLTVLGDEVLVGLEVIGRFIVTFEHGQRVIIKP